MTRRTLGTLAVSAALLLGPAAPALADHDYGGDRRGDCRDAENCQDNDFSPSFKDSPVRDAFNFSPQICLPGATCYFDGQRDQPEEGQPAS